MILLSFCNKKTYRNRCSHDFRPYSRKPDSVNAPEPGKNEDCGSLETEGAEKGYYGGNQAVVQGGKKPELKIPIPAKRKANEKRKNP